MVDGESELQDRPVGTVSVRAIEVENPFSAARVTVEFDELLASVGAGDPADIAKSCTTKVIVVE